MTTETETMGLYNATATVAGKLDESTADAVMDALAAYHAAVGASPTGAGWEVVITLPAETLVQAVQSAHAVLAEVVPAVGLEVLPTELWDRRAVRLPIPVLASVTETAERLGVTR